MDTGNLIESFAEFAKNKNVDRPTMIRILEDVFRTMIRKKYETDDNFDIIINADKGDLEIWRFREIVDDNSEDIWDHDKISLSDARKIEPDFEIGEEVAEEIFTIVEEPAAPVGGMEAFYKFVRKNLKYPSQARRMGIEGKVYVQFVVDKDGTITDVKAVKGIGAGCDEEAVRVINKSPRWNPPKQRGKPVKQRIILPITFQLG